MVSVQTLLTITVLLVLDVAAPMPSICFSYGSAADHPQQQRITSRSWHLSHVRQVEQAEKHPLTYRPAYTSLDLICAAKAMNRTCHVLL